MSSSQNNTEIASEPYFWSLYKTDKGLRLSVLCGRSAVFTITFFLNEQETLLYETKGKEGMQTLAYQVQDAPSRYSERE